MMFQRFIKDYVWNLPDIDTLVGLKECRVWLINAMMLFVLITLPIAMVSNLPIFSQKGIYPLIVIDLILYALVIFGFFSKKGALKIVPYIWMLIAYAMLITFFIFLGPHYARSAWLVMVAVMAALFFGTWGAVISTAMNACILMLIYFLMADNNGAWVEVLKGPIQEWSMFIVNVSLVTLISSFPLGFLLKRLDLSLNHEKEISKDLVSRNRELKALEEKARHYAENLKTIFDSAPNVLALVDNELRVEMMNRQGAGLLGKTCDDLVGSLCGDVFQCVNSFHGEGCGNNTECSLCPLRTLSQDTFKTGEPHIEKEGRITFLLNGEKRPMDILISTSLLNINGINKVLLSFTDITDRKRAENDLRDAKQTLGATLDGLSANIALLDSDGQILLVNKSWRDFAEANNLSADEVSEGKNYLQICDYAHGRHAEEATSFSAGIRSVLSGKKKYYELEYPCHSPNEERWFIGRVTVFPRGDQNRVIIAHENITERKRAEDTLKKNQQEIHSIFRAAPTGIGMVRDRVICKANDRLAEMTGYSEEELIGQSARIMYPSDDDYEYVGTEKYRQIALNGTGTVETKWKRKDGTITDVLLSSTPMDFDDLSTGVTFTALDITEIKEKELKLSESEEKYRSMMDSLEDLVYICSADYHIEFMNPAMMKWMGRDATGELCYNAIHGFNKTCPWCVHDNVIAGKQVGFEKSFADTNTYHISNSPIFHTDGSVSQLSIFRNITPLKKMETRVQQAQKMESIGNLAGGIAHDFNNILFPIIGLSEMLIEDLPKNSPENENVKEILKAGQRGSELVKQILAFSRQNEHTMTPIRVQFVMKEVLKLIRASIPMNIEISHQLQSDCGLVLADSTQLHQIGMNLITNAYHAVESGIEGKIEVQVREITLPPESKDSSLPPGQYAMLSVSDNGVGIDPVYKDKIFEPYFTTKEQGKGTGLGLSVVYGIVKEHKGDIKVFSEIGKGTTFNVYLPLMSKSDMVESGPEQKAVERGSEHILLVDDEAAISSLEKQILGRLGYTVSERNSSFDALEAFKANPDLYDLVISDMSMPQMTGDALAKEMLSIRPDLPIIICTGFSERVNEDLAKEMGIKGFLMKPVITSALAHEVRRVLDEKNMS
jgi:PAS domain S-box-containing protein